MYEEPKGAAGKFGSLKSIRQMDEDINKNNKFTRGKMGQKRDLDADDEENST